MAKNPSTRWYFNDWWSDLGLRACSVPARGLWIDMLTIAAIEPRPGYLVDGDGRSLSIPQLARMVGAPVSSVRRWLAELERHRVFSRDPDGVIFNRRMAREADQKSTTATPERTAGE
jgi:hypothetical protein